MIHPLLARLRKRARARDARVILPEGGDARIRRAASVLASEDLARPLLIGGTAEGAETLDPGTYPGRDRLTAAIAAQRPRMSAAMAQRGLARPLWFAGALLASGGAEAMVAGAVAPTARVIEAGLITVGPAEGIVTPSSWFLMLLDDRALVFSDCALVVEPTVEELADIAIAASRTGAALFGEARTALLSYSTVGSGTGKGPERARAALALARKRAPELAAVLDGEFQADTALNMDIAAKKGAAGGVAGRANVLVFPSLDAGNIAYKLVQELAGAQSIGPFLHGFARPISDLSRGATVDDIVAAAVVALALA